MKKMFFLFSIMFIISCKPDARYDLIQGEWKGAQWLVEGKPSGKNLSNVKFVFNGDKTFNSQLGAKSDKGIYKIEGEHLITQADNKLEIVVRINRLTSDSLILDMKQSGQSETLILIKK